MLEDVYVESLVPFELNYTSDNFKPKRLVLHVPPGTKELYEEAKGWKEFGEIIEDEAALGQFYKNGYKFQRTIYGTDVNLAFISDEKLTEASGSKILEIPETIEYKGDEYTVRGLSDQLLKGRDVNGIERITIPPSIIYTGNHNFTNMPDLKEIKLSSPLLQVGKGSFVNLPSLKEIDLYELDRINFESNSFINVGLESLVFPIVTLASFDFGDITHFGVLSDMPNLKKLDLGIIERTSRKQFNNLPKLEELKINASLVRIWENCFQNLETLNKIIFKQRGDTKLEIKAGVFENTPMLKDIYVEDEAPFSISFEIKENAIYPAKLTLHVPQGAKELYAAAPGWKEFGKIVEDGGVGAGIETAAADREEWKCSAVPGGLAINGEAGIAATTVTPDGRIAQQTVTSGECTTIQLPAGLYLVTARGTTVKIYVK